MKRNRLRQTAYAVAAILAVAFSGPMLPIELAVWFSGELLLYLEIATGVWLMSGVTSLKARIVSAGSRMMALPGRTMAIWTRRHPASISWVQQGLSIQ